MVPDGWGYLEPFCEGRESVEEFIPGLEAVKGGGRLAEPGIERAVLESGRFHLRQYGHLVRQALDPDWSFPAGDASVADWLPGLLAAGYWRIVGDPLEAVACLRKAIKFSPLKHRLVDNCFLA